MDRNQLNSFQGLLESMLKKARRPLSQREEISVENSPDIADLSQRMVESDLAIQQIESNFNRTQDIKLALQRITDGSYGSCLKCDCDISPNRLQAVPWTRYCVHCQEIEDSEKASSEAGGLQVLMRIRDAA